jgi:hypothetical protein
LTQEVRFQVVVSQPIGQEESVAEVAASLQQRLALYVTDILGRIQIDVIAAASSEVSIVVRSNSVFGSSAALLVSRPDTLRVMNALESIFKASPIIKFAGARVGSVCLDVLAPRIIFALIQQMFLVRDEVLEAWEVAEVAEVFEVDTDAMELEHSEERVEKENEGWLSEMKKGKQGDSFAKPLSPKTFNFF